MTGVMYNFRTHQEMHQIKNRDCRAHPTYAVNLVHIDTTNRYNYMHFTRRKV